MAEEMNGAFGGLLRVNWKLVLFFAVWAFDTHSRGLLTAFGGNVRHCAVLAGHGFGVIASTVIVVLDRVLFQAIDFTGNVTIDPTKGGRVILHPAILFLVGHHFGLLSRIIGRIVGDILNGHKKGLE